MVKFDAEHVLTGLNPRQQEAVQTTEGPVLVVAGPGSGKTRVLTCRIAWLLATETAKPHQVLALTFTNKAAREMRERVQKLLPKGTTKGMWVGTFHSQMVRLLRVEAEHLGFTSDFTIYDTDDTERLLKQLIDENDYDSKKIKPRTVHGYISEAKNALRTIDEMESAAKSKPAKAAVKLYQLYNNALKAANAFDFDDLLLKPIELFKEFPEILKKYQSKWSHVLIDEYQDTNHVQYRLAYALSEAHRNLCVVGDDAQSIYSFRGADIQNIFSFERDFKEAKVIRLEQNYRSTSTILDAADSVILNNKEQIKKKLWTKNEIGEKVKVIEALEGRNEAAEAVKLIRDKKARSDLRYEDFAILYRTNVQSRTFEDALRKAGMPYRIIGGISFYQRKEIKDAVAYLRLLVNPDDVSSFQRIVNFPTRGIGIKSQQIILEYARQPGFNLSQTMKEIHNLPISKRARNALRSFTDLIRTHTADMHSGMDPSEIAASLFRKSGLMKEMESDDLHSGQYRLDNVQNLLVAIQDYASEDESHTLSRYLQRLALMTDADTDQSKLDRVTLMTLHASKGLEFHVVFIGGLEDELLPLIRGEQISRVELEEERRLLYVGITRAKSLLFLGWARSRSRFGGAPKYPEPSRFLAEMDPRVLILPPETQKRLNRSDQLNHVSKGVPVELKKSGYAKKSTKRTQAPSHASTGNSYGKSKPKNLSGFRKGAKVYHKNYGDGTVTHVDKQGDSVVVTVQFMEHGMKRLFIKFAPMVVLD